MWVYDIDVDPFDPDIEFSIKTHHRIGFLDWSCDKTTYVEVGRSIAEVDDLSWARQGIASQMLLLARDRSPDLLHAECRDRISIEGEAFVRATNPEQACNNNCGVGCRALG